MTNKGWCEYCYLKDAKPCYECNACFNGSNFRKIKTNKPTNYDRIKNMSVEEMAEWYVTADACKYCTWYSHEKGTCHCFESNKSMRDCCFAATIKMLESEVTDNANE